MSRFAVISGDLRQFYINEYLNKLGFHSELKINFDFKGYDFIICSTPFSKDGNYVNCDFYSSFPISTFANLLQENQIVFGGNLPNLNNTENNISSSTSFKTFDVLKDDYVVWNNAALTAEGLIGKIIFNTDFCIDKAKVLIMGFGKCGINIATKLKALGAYVYIYDHTPVHLSQAESMGFNILEYKNFSHKLPEFSIVINTVPKPIFTPIHYELLSKQCVLFEIASAPFGLDGTLSKNNQLSLITCPALPGATAPKVAGELIAKSIISYLERNGINDV